MAVPVFAAGAFLLMDYLVSEPGESLTERAMAEPFTLNLDDVGWLSGPHALRAARPGTLFRCYEVRGVSLGTEVCWAAIRRYNRIDARVAALFFRDGQLSGLRVTFPAIQHKSVLEETSFRYGRGDPINLFDHGESMAATGWLAGSGSIFLTDPVPGRGDVLLVWSATRLEATSRSP